MHSLTDLVVVVAVVPDQTKSLLETLEEVLEVVVVEIP